MEFILNPIVISVVVLCALCLARVNVLLALIAASLVAGLTGGLGLTKSMELLSGGFSANATTALSYILLGTFAVAIAHTGLMQMLVRWIGSKMGGRPLVFCFGLAFIACLSQNVVPVHIAFIPLLIPPLLKLMNRMKLDRRAVSCALGFGLTAPYVSLPIGFGLIFQGIVAQSMTQNGMAVTVADVASVAWIAGLSMVVGLALAVFYFTRRPRTYLDKPVVGVTESDEEIRFGLRHWVTLGAIVAAVAVQIMLESLPLAALLGLIIMLAGGAFQFKKLDDHIASGISMMGFIVLMGTVVNNGIVFVDYANQLRMGGMERRAALIATGKTRMRPILMTTLTTVLAMLQLVFSNDMASQLMSGMAIVIICGLTYATIMTLYVVPLLYDLLFKKPPLNIDVGSDDLDDIPDDAAEYIAQSHAQPEA